MTKSIKELKSLIALSTLGGQSPDPGLVEELRIAQEAEQKENEFKNGLLESTKKNVQNFLQELQHEIASVVSEKVLEKQPLVEEAPAPVLKAEPKIEPVEKSLAERAVEQISKSEKLKENFSPFTQPSYPEVKPDLNLIVRKLKYIEDWVGKIMVTGTGGGAAEIYNLVIPTKTVTGDYVVGRKDYYIGVNASVKTYITLPTSGVNLQNGREVVIKDESGHAQLTPIKIIGTIDNDPNGAEIRINNGSVTLLYRDGWRII